MRRALVAAVALPFLVFIGGQAGLLEGHPPDDLGVNNGLLKAPSPTRNSVSSQADRHPGHPQQAHARLDPWPWPDPSQERSMEILSHTLSSDPAIRIVSRTDDYIHAEGRTRWLGFVDDLEFWADAAEKRIHVRSGSRLGREDFGTNRKRLESLRARYLAD